MIRNVAGVERKFLESARDDLPTLIIHQIEQTKNGYLLRHAIEDCKSLHTTDLVKNIYCHAGYDFSRSFASSDRYPTLLDSEIAES